MAARDELTDLSNFALHYTATNAEVLSNCTRLKTRTILRELSNISRRVNAYSIQMITYNNIYHCKDNNNDDNNVNDIDYDNDNDNNNNKKRIFKQD